MNRPLRGVHHHELRPARFALFQPQGHVVLRQQRPARQQQVAVTALFSRHIELIAVGGRTEVVGEDARLVVEAGAADIEVHLLQTNHVRLLLLDDLDDPLQAIPSVAADTLVDVVAEQGIAKLSVRGDLFPLFKYIASPGRLYCNFSEKSSPGSPKRPLPQHLFSEADYDSIFAPFPRPSAPGRLGCL